MSKAKKKIYIDLEDVRRLAILQCTPAEAAAFFKISAKKFNEILSKFEDVREAWEQGQQKRKSGLRI